MRYRHFHVANSSSSNFVLIGFDASNLNLSDDQIESIADGRKCNILWGNEGGAPSGVDLVLGYFLSCISTDEWTEPNSFPIDPIIAKTIELKMYVGADTPILVYEGTMAS